MTAACGGGASGQDGGSPLACPTSNQPTFELGTGEEAFEPLTDGQDLGFVAGVQGGCHFPLSVRSDGFAPRGFRLRYEVFYADTQQSTSSASSFTFRLEPTDEADGRCVRVNVTAFLIKPWELENERLEIRVNVEDGRGLMGSAVKTVVGRWPPNGGPNACGLRD